MKVDTVLWGRGTSLKRAVLTAVVAVTGASLMAAAPAAAGTKDNTFRVVQHNTDMGGWVSAVNEANEWGDVDAVTFQELCESQKDELVAAGWKVHWKPQKGKNSVCGDVKGKTRKGNAIATQRGFGKLKTFGLGKYGGRRFKLLCAEITGSGIKQSWVCTTHLAIDYTKDDGKRDGPGYRLAQTTKIAGILNPWVAGGRRVVLTGDFNALPGSPELGPIYRVEGNGKFWEGDQTSCAGKPLCRDMESTTDASGKRGPRKLDYFFASHLGVDASTGLSKGVLEKDTSGHHVIRGEVTFGPLG